MLKDYIIFILMDEKINTNTNVFKNQLQIILLMKGFAGEKARKV